MKLSAPGQVVFVISLLLAIVAVLLFLNVLHLAAVPSFWTMTAAYVVLFLGNILRGL
jgi:hypothetical protein